MSLFNSFGVPHTFASNGDRIEFLGDLFGDSDQWVAISAPFIYLNLFNMPFGQVSRDVGEVSFYNLSSISPTIPSFTMIGTSRFQALGIALSSIGDINGDGVKEIAIGTATPIMVNGAPSQFTVFDLLTGLPIRGHPYNIFAVGLGDVNQDGCDDYTLSTEGRGVSGLDGSTIYTINVHPDFGLAGCGDINGDGIIDLCSQGRFDSGKIGSLLFQSATPVLFPQILQGGSRSQQGSAGDFDGDGFDDGYFVRSTTTNWEVVIFSLVGAHRYGSQTGTSSTLDLNWVAGGQGDPAVGSLHISGGTPGGGGQIGVSLAPSSFDFLGLDVLIDPNPGNLVALLSFGYDQFGTLTVPAFIRSPYVAGVSFYFQAYQTGPAIEASNGLEIRFVP